MRSIIICSIAASAGFAPAHAEVVAEGAGFTVINTAEVSAPPPEVWARLLEPAEYWNGAHSFSGDAANMSLEAEAGGCFCETLPGGGSIEHMRVIAVMPGRLLRLGGGLGPLQSEGLAGALSWQLSETDAGGTKIEQIYVVGGHMRFDASTMAPAVDSVLKEQLTRLAAMKTIPKAEPH